MTSPRRLAEGEVLPDVALVDHDGRPWRLSDHRGRHLVLILHRHLACLPCQEHVLDVRDRIDELGDALPVVITFTAAPSQLAAHRAHLGVTFPVLADVDRSLYHRFGAGRGSLAAIWSPATLALYAQLLRRGRRLQRPTEDTRQLGVDAIVDRYGRLHRIWLPPGPAHRPTVAELIAAVRTAP